MKLVKYLLSTPFIITPILITNKFIDPSLNIKKISIFIFFTFISISFTILKVPKNSLSNHSKSLFKILAIYIIYQTVTSFYISINLTESLWEIFYLIGWFLIYIFLINYINNKRFKSIVLSTAIIGSLLSLLVYNDIYNIISLNIPSFGKLSATFGYKNFFAQYLCFVIPACLTSIYLIKNKKIKLIMILLSFIPFGALIFTRCRAAWLGIFFMLMIFCLINGENIKNDIKKILYNKKLLSIALVLIFTFLFIIVKPIDISTGIWIGDKSSIKDTLLSIKNIYKKSSWGDRHEMYQGTFEMIKDHPLFGVGYGNWKVVYPKYSQNNSFTDYDKHKVTLRPHNDILWIIAETGIIGLVFLIIFLGYHFRLLIVKFKDKNDNNEYLILFCILSLTAIFIESLFDFPKERVIPNLYIWLILSFIVSSKTKTDKCFNIVSILPITILPIITFFTFIDLKSQFYNQQIIAFKIKNEYKKMEMSSVISLYYMRNINHLAIPTTYYLGLAHYNMGNKDLASTFFNQSLTISPYHIGSLQNKMLMHIEKVEFDNARNIMLLIEEIYPKIYRARLNMIKYCIEAKNLNLAQNLLEDIDWNINFQSKNEFKQLQKSLY